ncbi:MAG: hypothetical protein IJT79_00525 [Ruminococcus sp.]|nr:hypothetical protein [Ruminococcus sp.]
MLIENKADKGFILFWEGKNEKLDKETKDCFRMIKRAGILPVVIESGSGDLEDSIYRLMKQNVKTPLEKTA